MKQVRHQKANVEECKSQIRWNKRGWQFPEAENGKRLVTGCKDSAIRYHILGSNAMW